VRGSGEERPSEAVFEQAGGRDANDLISDDRIYTDIAPVFAGLPATAAPAA
jgi:hypothetical protein